MKKMVIRPVTFDLQRNYMFCSRAMQAVQACIALIRLPKLCIFQSVERSRGPHTSCILHLKSHITHQLSNIMHHTYHITNQTLYITNHTFHISHNMSHKHYIITCHSSKFTNHTFHISHKTQHNKFHT